MRVRIEKLVYGGDGLARDAGLVWFVPRSAPGDIVEIEETELKPSYRRGRITRIIEASPLRAEPVCPWFSSCGGCQWQHIHYSAQVSAKQEILASMAEKALAHPPVEIGMNPSPVHWEYRRRISLHRDGSKIGYFAAGSNAIVPVTDCPIAEKPLREWLQNPPLSALEILSLPERFELRTDSFHVSISDTKHDQAFQQANSRGNLLLKEHLRDQILRVSSQPRIFDLFCGSGNLSLPLADYAASIKAWDVSAEAIGIAQKAAKRNKHVQYSRGQVAAVYKALKKESRRTDVLILDPPRKGVKKEAVLLAKLQIPVVAYVSCNPSSLMRDLSVFEEYGYTVQQLEVFDMFPQTYHMESLALLMLT